MKKILLIALTGAATLALVACGSSDNGAPAGPATDIPASAQQNSAGLLAFANQQIGASSDTGEPIVLGEAALPVDDTTETSL